MFDCNSNTHTLHGMCAYTPADNSSLLYMYVCFQAYLTRAAQFAGEERLAKAILNCNEAIALKPESSRAFMYRYMHAYIHVHLQYIQYGPGIYM